MQRLQIGDNVVVISGNDRGKTGKITDVLPQRNAVIIEGLNRVKKHLKPTPTRPGGILEVEGPIHMSKVMLLDPETGKRTRVRHKVEEGKKVRVAKSGTPIVVTESE